MAGLAGAPLAKRGDVCLARVEPKDEERRYCLARVVRANDDGLITHVDLDGALPEPDHANALRRLAVGRTWSIRGPRGERVKARCEFPCAWPDFATAKSRIAEWWGPR